MFLIPALSALRTRVLVVLAAACAILTVGAPAPAVASHAQIVFFEAPHDLLSPARHASFLKLERLGVKALRVELHWHDVVPGANSSRRPKFDATNPASYRWGGYDYVLEEAARLKWPVLLTVTAGAPKWATANHRDFITRPDPKALEQFMTAIGRHYGSEVTYYAIWNEPNIPGWLLPQFNSNGTPASPRIYRGLWQAGYEGLKAAGITSPKVLFGETAPFGVDRAFSRSEDNHQKVAPLEFMRLALCLNRSYHKASTCSKLPIYGYAHHPYTYPAVQGPFYRPPETDQVTIGSLDRLSNALEKASHAHAIPNHIPMYLTEFGVESKPNFLGVSQQQQAEYDAISERIAWNNRDVVAFSQYLLTDENPHNGLNGYRTGLQTSSGGFKTIYYSYPLPLVVNRSSSGYSLWGLVRPATGVTKVKVRVQTPGSRSFRTLAVVSTDSHGYWSLHSSTRGVTWRVSWRSPTGVAYNGPPIGSN